MSCFYVSVVEVNESVEKNFFQRMFFFFVNSSYFVIISLSIIIAPTFGNPLLVNFLGFSDTSSPFLIAIVYEFAAL